MFFLLSGLDPGSGPATCALQATAAREEHVHRRPSPQVTFPERVSASLQIRTCCGTFVLYPPRPTALGDLAVLRRCAPTSPHPSPPRASGSRASRVAAEPRTCHLFDLPLLMTLRGPWSVSRRQRQRRTERGLREAPGPVLRLGRALVLRFRGQADLGGQSAFGARPGPDGAAVCGGDGADDGQAQACPAAVVGAVGGKPPERFEER